jgi:hypothetical protein
MNNLAFVMRPNDLEGLEGGFRGGLEGLGGGRGFRGV